ncbi:MAG: hypothetical protein J4A00_09140 [Gammaproteobacteria bacterium]|nr:hypothetical protein [Gammaproteobacteria bacterium]
MFDINVVFPTFFVDLTYVWMLTYNFWPVSVDKTIYEISWCRHQYRVVDNLVNP